MFTSGSMWRSAEDLEMYKIWSIFCRVEQTSNLHVTIKPLLSGAAPPAFAQLAQLGTIHRCLCFRLQVLGIHFQGVISIEAVYWSHKLLACNQRVFLLQRSAQDLWRNVLLSCISSLLRDYNSHREHVHQAPVTDAITTVSCSNSNKTFGSGTRKNIHKNESKAWCPSFPKLMESSSDDAINNWFWTQSRYCSQTSRSDAAQLPVAKSTLARQRW